MLRAGGSCAVYLVFSSLTRGQYCVQMALPGGAFILLHEMCHQEFGLLLPELYQVLQVYSWLKITGCKLFGFSDFENV